MSSIIGVAGIILIILAFFGLVITAGIIALIIFLAKKNKN